MRNTFQAPLHLEKFIEQHLTKPLQTKNDHNALRLAKYGSSLHLFYICDWITKRQFKRALLYLACQQHYRKFIECPQKIACPLNVSYAVEKNKHQHEEKIQEFHRLTVTLTKKPFFGKNLYDCYTKLLWLPIEKNDILSDITKEYVKLVFNSIDQFWDALFRL